MVNDVYKSVLVPTLTKCIQSHATGLNLLSYRALRQLDENMVDTLPDSYPNYQIELTRKIVTLPVKPLKWFLVGYL